ncbi:hypothetical protein HZF05_12550 [Sphingomonas sp. CGMCC 1.13654]|uniref:Uncharacterized protein n=1 Tax=Sphingomonas chungangi TaxID=2683589 RepID=A0A838LBR7_9SPHN|nr:hypothetical protein [Sphingomonas chungangi]MBA2934928.1 hypothetical protein [Sphingomonas chungangi]MVW58239.1 hypothetical protein [Sphingomonas chungangi]
MQEASETRARRRIALDAIPEMARPVGLFGTLQRAEVGGSICFSAVVTIGMYNSLPGPGGG